MHASYPHLTPVQREAIAEDPETHKVYVLVEQPRGITLDDQYIQDQLSKGIAALEAGERTAWDPERIKQEGRWRLAARKAPE